MQHWHNSKSDILSNGRKFWKGETTLNYPSAPPQPSTAEAIQQWVTSMPQVYQTQMQYEPQLQAASLALQAPYAEQMLRLQNQLSAEYEPQIMERQMQLQKEYMPQFAQAQYDINKSLYPTTAGLQETMAGQANQGMTATTMPDWMRKQALSDMNAQLGPNASSPIGADYVSRGMQNQLFQQQKYYRDLGLSLAGRQPLISGQAQQTPQVQTPTYQNQANYMSSFTPSSVASQMGQNYGTYAQAARPIAMQDTKKYGLGWLLSM